MEEIIRRLSQAISNSNLSYAELEKRTKIAKSSLQRYATGITKKIPMSAVEKIAKATNTSAAWIMCWEEETPNKNEDAVSDILAKIYTNEKIQKATSLLCELNDEQLDLVIAMISNFKQE